MTPTPDVCAAYRQMQTLDLLHVQAAFESDYKDDLTEEGKDFCRGRLALISEILAARATS